jgi:hypothetical protein
VVPRSRTPPRSIAPEIPSRKLWVGNLHPKADKRFDANRFNELL